MHALVKASCSRTLQWNTWQLSFYESVTNFQCFKSRVKQKILLHYWRGHFLNSAVSAACTRGEIDGQVLPKEKYFHRFFLLPSSFLPAEQFISTWYFRWHSIKQSLRKKWLSALNYDACHVCLHRCVCVCRLRILLKKSKNINCC